MAELTINDCRPEVRAFAVLMERELRANAHKRGWKHDSPRALLERLEEESVELLEAASIEPRVYISPKQVAKEAADVGNFAMMIADVCGALPAEPGQGE